MSAECAILIASAKIPVGKKCDFSWPYIRLTKQCFLPPPHWIFLKVYNIKIEKQIGIPS